VKYNVCHTVLSWKTAYSKHADEDVCVKLAQGIGPDDTIPFLCGRQAEKRRIVATKIQRIFSTAYWHFLVCSGDLDVKSASLHREF
jgi:hypothetical protein